MQQTYTPQLTSPQDIQQMIQTLQQSVITNNMPEQQQQQQRYKSKKTNGEKRKRRDMNGIQEDDEEDERMRLKNKKKMRAKMNKSASSKFAPWMVHMVNKELELAPIEVGVQVYIRGESYTNWVPKRLYTSHKYHMKFTLENMPLVYNDHLLQANVRLIHGTSKKSFEKGAAIKATNDTKMNPSLTRKSDVFEGEMRFQLLLSSYKMPKGDKHFQFHVDFVSVITNTTLFTIRSPEFEVFARKNDAEPLPEYAVDPLRLSDGEGDVVQSPEAPEMQDDSSSDTEESDDDDDDDSMVEDDDDDEREEDEAPPPPLPLEEDSEETQESSDEDSPMMTENLTKIEPASPFPNANPLLPQRTPLKKRKMAFGAAIQVVQSLMNSMDPTDRERAIVRIKEELLH
mmetsp:Transcript_11792/g.17507  ORF Transcript_11792/g.17507 Transcript_11792/m.17507 type:complete len:399 (+) Transcript_11792:833-2029(+)